MPRIYSPRLKNFDYVGPLAAHLVFVTRERGDLFTDEENANICLAALQEAATKYDATIHAYCVMPNHVHILAEIGRVSLKAFVRVFKQLSGFRLKHRSGSEVWQISYYDHILRSDEDILDVARYIWEIQLKTDVADFLEYQFSGPHQTMTALQTR